MNNKNDMWCMYYLYNFHLNDWIVCESIKDVYYIMKSIINVSYALIIDI